MISWNVSFNDGILQVLAPLQPGGELLRKLIPSSKPLPTSDQESPGDSSVPVALFLGQKVKPITDQGSNQEESIRDVITKEVQLAGQQWAQHLKDPGHPVTINVRVVIDSSIDTASTSDEHVDNSGGYLNAVAIENDPATKKTVAEPLAAYQLGTGATTNFPSIEIHINPNFWSNSVHDLTTGRSQPIAEGQADGVSIFMHEIGHAIAFNGFQFTSNSQSDKYESSFDKNVVVFPDGHRFFEGSNAESVYGPVPLTNGYHVTGASLQNDLMYESNGASPGFYGQHAQISPLDLAILADCGFKIKDSLPSAQGGFNGDQVTSSVLFQPVAAASPVASPRGTATVTPGVTTFPHIAGARYGSSVTPTVDASATFKGSSITIDFPASEKGASFWPGLLNEYVFETAPNNPPITGISLFSTNIPKLTAANVTTTAHAINVNVSNLILPTDAPAFIHLSATFGPSTGSAPPQGQPSPDGTSVNTDGLSITDAAGNVWKLNHGLVNVNGTDDQTTARVIALAYKGGKIWQENADKLWWSKTASSDQWSPPGGAPTPPEAVPLAASADSTVVTNGLQAIIDATQNTWSIVNEQVSVNGHIDPTTKNVIELAYKGGAVWQENTDHLWWMKASPSDQWSPAAGTPAAPV